jgi:hypothetical protein
MDAVLAGSQEGGIGFLAGTFLEVLTCTGRGVFLADNADAGGREESGSSSSVSPLVISVNSQIIPSNSYASCKGRQGRVYRAVIVAFAVSA